VDVIGIQTHMHHLGDAISEERLWNALNEYEKYGLPLQLSEITVLSCEMFPDWRSAHVWYDKVEAAKQAGEPALSMPSLPAWEVYQAALTRDFYTLAFSHPGVEAIIWWTITDVEPWRGMPAGLLDEQGQPKPVYHVLDELINEEWHTEKRGLLSENGVLDFRGFYGTYAVEVEHEGELV
jgi:GH35 family endo-1,4-beta-xylanase